MMNAHTLDIMVTHLVQRSCNGAVESLKCDDTTLVQKARVSNQSFITCFSVPDEWNSVLRRFLLSKCSINITVPRPFVDATWRETNNRRVLAPLPLKQNCDNFTPVSTDMQICRKRYLPFENISIPLKHPKIEPNNVVCNIKPCRVLLKKRSIKKMFIEYKCLNTKSSVKLLDVFKEIPQVKQEEKPVNQADFMHFLNLNSSSKAMEKPQVEIKTSHPVKLVNHHQIPFSSDYGRHLLVKDKHFVSEEVVLKKLERTEWYLKTTSRSRKAPAMNLDITFSKRGKNQHYFTFPKRQQYQNHTSLKNGFLNYICKPLCINVQRMDLNAVIKARQESKIAAQLIKVEKTEEPFLPAEAEHLIEKEVVLNGANKFDTAGFLGLDGEHLISNGSDVIFTVASDETINEPVLMCSCGEKIVLSSLLNCTKKTVKEKRKNGVRRSKRLLNSISN